MHMVLTLEDPNKIIVGIRLLIGSDPSYAPTEVRQNLQYPACYY